MYVRIMSKCNNRNICGVWWGGEVETCEKARNVILKDCPPLMHNSSARRVGDLYEIDVIWRRSVRLFITDIRTPPGQAGKVTSSDSIHCAESAV